MKHLSFFFCGLLLWSGCSDPPTSSDGAHAQVKNFFTPDDSRHHYLWVHHDERNTAKDSLYKFSYVGRAGTTFDGFSPISLYSIISQDGASYTQEEYFLSDSSVIWYGSSATSDTARIVLLRDTLRQGLKWRASDTYKSSDGVTVVIDAEADTYYANIFIGNKNYSDVYRVTYYPKPSAPTQDTALQVGARHVYYYGYGVGKLMEYVYAADSSLIWRNELIGEN